MCVHVYVCVYVHACECVMWVCVCVCASPAVAFFFKWEFVIIHQVEQLGGSVGWSRDLLDPSTYPSSGMDGGLEGDWR